MLVACAITRWVSVDVIAIVMSGIKACENNKRGLCFVGGERKTAYQGLSPSRSRFSSVAALRMSNGTAEWTHCASRLIWACSASGVMRREVRVSRETCRKAGGRGGAPGTVRAVS